MTKQSENGKVTMTKSIEQKIKMTEQIPGASSQGPRLPISIFGCFINDYFSHHLVEGYPHSHLSHPTEPF